MSIRYEYYIENDDTQGAIWGAQWQAQTFTPSIAHTITSVKLLLFRLGSPGTITVSIRNTDTNGLPTGGDLCSGTTDGDTLPTAATPEWREITFGGGYLLNANIKYAIVSRAVDGNETNQERWRQDNSDPIYAGGKVTVSTDSGENWSSADRDFMFEDWGEPALNIPCIPLGLIKGG